VTLLGHPPRGLTRGKIKQNRVNLNQISLRKDVSLWKNYEESTLPALPGSRHHRSTASRPDGLCKLPRESNRNPRNPRFGKRNLRLCARPHQGSQKVGSSSLPAAAPTADRPPGRSPKPQRETPAQAADTPRSERPLPPLPTPHNKQRYTPGTSATTPATPPAPRTLPRRTSNAQVCACPYRPARHKPETPSGNPCLILCSMGCKSSASSRSASAASMLLRRAFVLVVMPHPGHRMRLDSLLIAS
jgi:hypothetical protein